MKRGNEMENQRVAIITGGTRGMGKAISESLAKQGNIVCAVYRSNEDAAQETEQIIKQYNPLNATYRSDVSNEKEAKELAEKIGMQFGRIDILVNNAGIFSFNYLCDMEAKYLQNVWNVNFMSQFYMIKYCAPYMKKNMYGRIANASSISGRFADCGLIAYAASKASVDMMTKISAAELGPFNITVNAYAPGIIHTDMTHEMILERGDIQVQDLCINRFGTGEDVAALVDFLTSEAGGYVTGEIIGVDGGMFKVQNTYLSYKKAKEEERQ